jgi:hypothetical protein
MSKSKLLILLLFVLFLFGCRKEWGHPTWETGIVTPLAKTTLTINDLLADSLIQQNADSSLTLVYRNELYSITPDTLVKIPDTTIANTYNYTFGPSINMSGGDFILPNTISSTEYDLNGAELTRAIIRSGGIRFNIANKVKAPIRFNYRIPTATLNNVVFDITVVIPAGTTSGPGLFSSFYDLSGYDIDLTGTTGNQVNTLVTSSWAQIDPAFTGTVVVYNTDSLKTNITFDDVTPSFAIGYFGQESIAVGPETSDFSIFSRITGGSLQLEDVNIELELENGIGADARLNIADLIAMNTRTGSSIALNHSLIGSNININRAYFNGSGGLVKTYNNYSLTPQNSNIKQMIESLPDKLAYTLQADINPLGNVSGHKDFLAYGQGLKASLNITLPLSLVANDLTLADTVTIDIDPEQAEKIRQGTFTLFADNGFPFDAQVQMFILDSYNNPIDSIMPVINHIDEAPVGADLKVVSKKLTKLVVPVSESKMSSLLTSKKLLLVTKFNTAAQPSYIKIYSHYGIDLKLTGDFDYEFEVD